MRFATPDDIPDVVEEMKRQGLSMEEIGKRVMKHYHSRDDDEPSEYTILVDEETYEIQGIENFSEEE